MSNLEKETNTKYLKYLIANWFKKPKFVRCTIKWGNEDDFTEDVILALADYDIIMPNEYEDNNIFFYFPNFYYLKLLLANIDDLKNRYNQPKELYEINNEDFSIIEVHEFANSLSELI